MACIVVVLDGGNAADALMDQVSLEWDVGSCTVFEIW